MPFSVSVIMYANKFQLYANSTYVVSVSNHTYVSSQKYVTDSYIFNKRIQKDSINCTYVVLPFNLVQLSLQKGIVIY